MQNELGQLVKVTEGGHMGISVAAERREGPPLIPPRKGSCSKQDADKI